MALWSPTFQIPAKPQFLYQPLELQAKDQTPKAVSERQNDSVALLDRLRLALPIDFFPTYAVAPYFPYCISISPGDISHHHFPTSRRGTLQYLLQSIALSIFYQRRGKYLWQAQLHFQPLRK
jgi:hypothetical protein